MKCQILKEYSVFILAFKLFQTSLNLMYPIDFHSIFFLLWE